MNKPKSTASGSGSNQRPQSAEVVPNPPADRESTNEHVQSEIESLRSRLAEMEDVAAAIRNGAVDAFVVGDRDQARIFALTGYDHPYRRLVETMGEGALALDENGRILLVNQRFSHLIRIPREQVLGETFQRFVSPSDVQRFDALLALEGGGRAELMLQPNEGPEIPVQISCSRADLGNLQATCMVVTDLSARKNQEELVASERLARSILEQASEAMLVCDASGQITHVSGKAEELCGGNPIHKTFDAACPVRVVAEPGGASGDGAPAGHMNLTSIASSYSGLEVAFERPDGRRLHLLMSSEPLYGQERKLLGRVVTLVDITEKKQMMDALAALNEELEQRVEERTAQATVLAQALMLVEQRERRRLSQMLHDDVQQMLFGMELRGEALRRAMPPDQPELQHRIGELVGELKKALVATRTLAIELDPPVFRNEGLRGALEWLAEHMEKRHDLVVDLDIPDEARIPSDELRTLLVQLARELLFNVVKHAGTGRAGVTVRREDDTLSILVEDNGRGFDVHVLALDSSERTSLGLFSLNERLRLVGGKMEIESTPGEGTRVLLRIPLRREGIRAPEETVPPGEVERALRALNRELEERVAARTAELERVTHGLERHITDREEAERALREIEWLLVGDSVAGEAPARKVEQPWYGDLTELNEDRTVRDGVGPEMLLGITSEYLDMLGTSSAIYEKNGDYAFRALSSGWCRFLDEASRAQCGTSDNREALASGKWHYHEACWASARASMEKRAPVDGLFEGGINIFSAPIMAGEEVVGSINFGYGDPTTDPSTLRELAERFEVDEDELRRHAESYDSRPPFVIEVAKRRLQSSARLIGEIVQRRRTEEALRESEQRYRVIFEDSSDAIALVDATTGHHAACNRQYEETTGYSRDELLSMSPVQLTPPEQRVRVTEQLEMLKSGAPILTEVEILTKEGRLISGEANARLVTVAGRPFIHGILRDISERKKDEDALRALNQTLEHRVAARTASLEQKNRDLQSFAFVASHDLQEPLRKIQAFAGLLKEEAEAELNETGQFYLDRLQQAALRMSQLLSDVLAFSRVATVKEAFRRVNVAEIAREVISDMELSDLEVDPEIEIDADIAIDAQPGQLRQLLSHLIQNALKFKRPGVRARVCISAEIGGPGAHDNELQPLERQEWCRLVVEDNGIGFEQKYAERIFDPFQRLHGRAKYLGTGMGLAICRRIVEQHAGTIRAESTPGVGTRLVLALPVRILGDENGQD